MCDRKTRYIKDITLCLGGQNRDRAKPNVWHNRGCDDQNDGLSEQRSRFVPQ